MTSPPIVIKEIYNDEGGLDQITISSGPVCFVDRGGGDSEINSQGKGKKMEKGGTISITSSEQPQDNNGQYRVALDHLGRECPDQLGVRRWKQSPTMKDGVMLTTDELDRLIDDLCHRYSPLFKPVPIIFIPSAGKPEYGDEKPIAQISKYDVVIRIFCHNMHYTALAHFRTIYGLIAFDPFGKAGLSKMATSQMKIDPSIGDDVKIDDKSYWRKMMTMKYAYQQGDGWTCGLWCLAFLEACLISILEQISINEAAPDYIAAMNSIRQRVESGDLRRMEVEEANRIFFERMTVVN